uniref:short-chain fatty acyl-CoA regulator family protein n=1 Tax=uncultured Sphingomonas sp. TaxID=158754 RepID=UPI0035CBF688
MTGLPLKADRVEFARFGRARRLTAVNEPVAIPDRRPVQRAEMLDGTDYVSMTQGLVKTSSRCARSSRRHAVALGCKEGDARAFGCADGVCGQSLLRSA